MTDRPIIFSAAMVQALLAGRKTQTRRILKPQPGELDRPFCIADGTWHVTDSRGGHMSTLRVPYAVGDRLWVRESFITGFDIDDEFGRPVGDRKVWYRATDRGLTWYDPDTESTLDNPPWKSSTQMPRWASRLTLIVTDVRVQRLQDINRGDAMGEGCPFPNMAAGPDPREWFRAIWNSIHGPDAWDRNDWVAALTFETHRQNIDQINQGDMK